MRKFATLGLAPLALLVGGVEQVRAGFFTAAGITQMSVTPANFQNSDILSVAVSPSGNVVASSGSNIATVPFDGSASTSTPLPFGNNFVYTPDMAYQNGVLNV